jgi:hypothetical protein
MLNWLKNLVKDRRGDINSVIVLIVVIAMMVIGVFILASFQGSMPTITDPVANATATNIFNAGWNGFSLLVVLPIVIAATVVIGYLIRGFGAGR